MQIRRMEDIWLQHLIEINHELLICNLTIMFLTNFNSFVELPCAEPDGS
jgi:hypothetical protein